MTALKKSPHRSGDKRLRPIFTFFDISKVRNTTGTQHFQNFSANFFGIKALGNHLTGRYIVANVSLFLSAVFISSLNIAFSPVRQLE